jgi:hypothetical protein
LSIENSLEVVKELMVSDNIKRLFLMPLFADLELAANSIVPILGSGRVLSSLSIMSHEDGSWIEKSLFWYLNNHSAVEVV